MAELNPVFSVRFTIDSTVPFPNLDGLTLNWDYLGPYYAYTVESQVIGSTTGWKPVYGIAWPIRANHWTAPRPTVRGPAQIYRVRAEIKQPAPNDPPALP